jgi:hypothetical protein
MLGANDAADNPGTAPGGPDYRYRRYSQYVGSGNASDPPSWANYTTFAAQGQDLDFLLED